MPEEVATVAAEGVSTETPQQTGETTARIPEGYVPKEQLERDVSAVRSTEQRRQAQLQRDYDQRMGQLERQHQEAMASLQQLQFQTSTAGLDDEERVRAENNLLRQQIQGLVQERQGLQIERENTLVNLRVQEAIGEWVAKGVPAEELDTYSREAMAKSAKKYLREQEREKKLTEAISALRAQVPQQVQKAKQEAVRETRESLGVDAVELGGPSGAPLTSIEEIEKKLAEAIKASKPREATRLSMELAMARRQ